MFIWFIISLIGFVSVIPFLFISVEHIKLERKFGPKKGEKIGSIIGMISGWAYFVFWIGIWVSPQPRFKIDFSNLILFEIPILNIPIYLLHFIVFIPFITSAIWFGIMGAREVTLKVAETHEVEKIVTTGVYSYIRHPQYFGGILAHIGITFLLSSYLSLLITPLIIFINVLISWKEEKELIKEFGDDYREYKKKVPMFIPRGKKIN
ncbi:MAG: isoprenylcysteine carboxylmethyltransferase family protein [Promethearchaeota archaeon]|nr:MAG: isoprenylcysteine carboxylmethyltransferase family protein [Candidatus Lokiarchaeota archaeon]